MSSIRDVARVAHVSPATVSRILNKQMEYNTSPETRERVLRAVTELDYKPLVKDSAAMKRKDEKVGVSIGCLLTATKGKYSDPYYLDILSGIESEMEQLGGTVTFVQTEYNLEDPAVLNRLRDSRLDGLVLMRWLAEEPFEKLRSVVPHIVGIDTGHMPVDNIEYDHRHVSRIAVEYLYSKGHRQIGFIGSGTGATPMIRSRRYRGYREVMNDLGLEIRPEWVLDCRWDDKLCMKLIEKTYRTYGLPGAFYISSDLMAMAGLRELYQLGIRVPEQVAVIGMSNIEMSQYANPPLTTINVPTFEMGIIAARTLMARIQGDTSLPKRIILPSELIERDSV